MEITTKELLNEIRTNLKQKNASQKDEVRVMQAMLNDDSYKVAIYDKTGEIGTYCPAEDFKSMTTSIIASAAKVTKEEARSLSENHEVSKSEAASMVGISKEFINTYLETGRKLPLGGREETNFALSRKLVPEKIKPCPRKVGVKDTGEDIYETPNKTIPEHIGLKAYSSCPDWIKNN
jgi:DNA-binding transcriptional regulator YiaG